MRIPVGGNLVDAAGSGQPGGERFACCDNRWVVDVALDQNGKTADCQAECVATGPVVMMSPKGV